MTDERFTSRLQRIEKRLDAELVAKAVKTPGMPPLLAVPLSLVIGAGALTAGRLIDFAYAGKTLAEDDWVGLSVTSLGAVGVGMALTFVGLRLLGLTRLSHAAVAAAGFAALFFGETALIDAAPDLAATVLPSDYLAARAGG